MPVSSLVLTENNLVRTGTFNASTVQKPYNRLYFTLPTDLTGKKIALQKANLYYSWANINANNNTFQISFPTGATFSDVNITIPVGTNFSSISEMNNYLQTVMIANGFYLIDNNQDNVYYMSLVANPTSYGVSLVQVLVPTSLPSGWSTPANFPAGGFPTTSKTMKFTTDTSQFNLLIGFQASTTFNGVATGQTFNSTFTPQLSPTSTVLVKCSHANNSLSLNGDSSIIYSFTTRGTSYGSLIEVEPQNIVYYNITSNSNNLIIEFSDQDNAPLQIQDPNMSVLLLISDE
ncbi:MAG: hypothetical protein RLZZ195_887 [Pseudomonadota bacterium]|jgi:hypothetical protein